MSWILSTGFLLLIGAISLFVVFIKKPERFSFSDKPVSEAFDLNEYLKGNWIAEYIHKQSRERIREKVTFGEGGRYHANGERVPLYIIKQIKFDDKTSELSWQKVSYSLKSKYSTEKLQVQDTKMTGVDSLGFEVVYEREANSV